MATETLALGFALKVSNMASSATFTEIDGLFSPSGPSRSREVVELRHHGSDSIKKLASFLNNGEFSFSIYFDSDDTQHAQLETAFANGTVLDFQAVFTDTGTRQYAFSGFLSAWAPDAQVGEANAVSATIVLTTDVTVS